MSVRTYSGQKAALTRALKISSPSQRRAVVLLECDRTKREWESGQGQFTRGWPDDWSRWQRALDDSHLPGMPHVDLDEL